MPWATGEFPFDRPGQTTYPSFFSDREAVADYRRYRDGNESKNFEPGVEKN
jgi:hypothetical protein